MRIRPAPQRPVVLAVRFLDGQVVDAGQTKPHQALVVELPVLVAVRAEPVPLIIVSLVGETDGNAAPLEGPQLLDQAIVEFAGPLAGEEGDDLPASVEELRAVSPARIERVGLGYLLGIARVPGILGETDLLRGGLPRERRERRTWSHGCLSSYRPDTGGGSVMGKGTFGYRSTSWRHTRRPISSARVTMSSSSMVSTRRSRISQRPSTITDSTSPACPLWIQPDTMRRVGTRWGRRASRMIRSAFLPTSRLPTSPPAECGRAVTRAPFKHVLRTGPLAVLAGDALHEEAGAHRLQHVLRHVVGAHGDVAARRGEGLDGRRRRATGLHRRVVRHGDAAPAEVGDFPRRHE